MASNGYRLDDEPTNVLKQTSMHVFLLATDFRYWVLVISLRGKTPPTGKKRVEMQESEKKGWYELHCCCFFGGRGGRGRFKIDPSLENLDLEIRIWTFLLPFNWFKAMRFQVTQHIRFNYFLLDFDWFHEWLEQVPQLFQAIWWWSKR